VPITAEAHVLVVASVPAEGETVTPPARLLLRFNSRIEKTVSGVTLAGPHSTAIMLPAQESEQPDTLASRPNIETWCVAGKVERVFPGRSRHEWRPALLGDRA